MELHQVYDEFVLVFCTLTTIQYYTEGLVIKPEHLTIGDKIGLGTWGVVCKGIYFGTEVAIKMINVPDGGLTQKTLTEVTILR